MHKKNCYLVNYPCMPIEHLITSWENNERSKPFNELTKAIIQSGMNCILCENGWDGSGIKDALAIILLNSDLNDSLLINLAAHPQNRCFLVLLEPPNMARFLPHYDPALKNIFGTIFTLFDDLADNETYYKIHHWQARSKGVEEKISFQAKKFCAMIQTRRSYNHPDSLFAERDLAAAYFAKDPGFDLYGCHWDGFSAWRGVWKPDKLDLLKHYRYTICYDNTRNRRGFITERVIEAFYAKCVPIYWGAPDVKSVIPPDCFIDRTAFGSNDELYAYLKSIDETSYKKTIKAGQAFLQSPFAKEHFSVDSFAKSVLHRVQCLIR